MLIEEILDMPKDTVIGSVIPKKTLFEATEINKSDKDVFTKFVKQMNWCYKINDESLRVVPYRDDEREYLEMEVFNILLKEETFEVYFHNTGNYHRYDAKLDRIADIILRFIPYPILIAFQFKNEVKLYGSHIKESLTDFDKITLDEIINTNWINFDDLTEFDEELFDNLKLNNLDFANVFTFYDSILTAIIRYNGSKEIGQKVELSSEEIQEIMNQIKVIDRQIFELKAKIKKENNFNKQFELSIQIKELEMDKKILQDDLIN